MSVQHLKTNYKPVIHAFIPGAPKPPLSPDLAPFHPTCLLVYHYRRIRGDIFPNFGKHIYFVISILISALHKSIHVQVITNIHSQIFVIFDIFYSE